MPDINDKHNISGGLIAQPPETFQVRSATAQANYDVSDIPPPFPMYIGVDDSLQITTLSAAAGFTVQVNVRVLGVDGLIHPFQFDVVTVAARAAQTNRFQLMEGYILSLSAIVTGGNMESNPIWIAAGVTRSPFGVLNTYCQLIAGYGSINTSLTYPTSPVSRTTEGNGFYHSATQSAPAAGADITFTVPTAARFRLVSFVATLTAAVAVANRLVFLVIDDGANIVTTIPSGVTLVAATVNTYCFADSTPVTAVFDAASMGPLPSNCLLPSGFRVRTVTANLQAADQWSAAFMLVGDFMGP
jgi:hypothetical protein